MLKLCLVVVALVLQGGRGQDDEEPYRGKLIGSFHSYHHQVSGMVYAVDEWTLQLAEFNYDGTGDDAFLWAGEGGRPGPHGYIVPDEHGRTNILERYYNADLIVKLPEGKTVRRLQWLAVYDVASQNVFADVTVPDDFSAPQPLALGPLQGKGVQSGPVTILDSHTLLVPELVFDGRDMEAYWWGGVGPQPGPRGHKIPDQDGYLEPLGQYSGVDVRLSLGAAGVRGIQWIALWDKQGQRAIASLILPAEANVPPAPAKVLPYKSTLPYCRQLHRSLQVSWEVFGNTLTFQLAGLIGLKDYMAIGVSGSETEARMVGADVLVARLDDSGRPVVTDYNITDQAPCVLVLGALRGVCRDEAVGGREGGQVLAGGRDGALTTVTFRRNLKPDEAMDLEWPVDKPVSIVWAVGALEDNDPVYHALWNRAHTAIQLNGDTADNDCVPFVNTSPPPAVVWEVPQLFDPALRVYTVQVGPRGVRAPPQLGYYINGQIAPDLQLRRGLTYTFNIFGGNDPHSATLYHPLVISAAARGGLERLAEKEQRQQPILAGVTTTRRGRLQPTHAGPLCLWSPPGDADPRRVPPPSFRAYNRTLSLQCGAGAGGPAALTVTPNTSWPDTVYYHSFTHTGMGGRIFIVDRHQRKMARGVNGATVAALSLALLALAAGVSGAAATAR